MTRSIAARIGLPGRLGAWYLAPILVHLLCTLSCGQLPEVTPDPAAVHEHAFVWDGHIDTPSHIHQAGHDMGRWADSTQVDLPKMQQGGLDGALFAIFVYPTEVPHTRMAAYVCDVIESFEAQVQQYAGQIEIAETGADIDRIHEAGKKVAVLSIEGGHPIQNSLDTLRMLYDRGIRSVTLTHFVTNEWADPSQRNQSSMPEYFASIPWHGGLTEFGREVVREMNRLGIVIDLSHSSPQTCLDVLETSSDPLIFSHSAVLSLCDHHRNVDDDLLLRLKDNGGVFCVTYVRQYLNKAYQDAIAPIDRSIAPELREIAGRMDPGNVGAINHARRVVQEKARSRVPMPTSADLVDHIDYLVRLIGVDHVGLGSDFDGWWNQLGDVRDASELPNITRTLLERGYSQEDIGKILGGNLVRVLKAVMR